MSCILRVWGAQLAVDALALATSLKPYRLDHRGQPRRVGGRILETSCANFDVSSLDFHEFEGQIAEAIEFLQRHTSELRVIMSFPGVQGAVLDFGVAWKDVAAQTDRLPPGLLALAGNLGIGIDLSHYPVADRGSAEAAGA